MQDSLTLHRNMVIRREPKKLPSVWQHLFAAATLLIFTWLGFTLAKYAFGDAADAIAHNELSIDPIPLPPVASSLDGNSEVLPDLLEGEVAANTNPTESLDALGNAPGGLAGSRPTADTAASGPKTIMIDGQTISGASAALAKAPIPGLSRLSPYGNVPMIAADGRKAVSAYARPFTPTGKNTVSVIVGGLGINAAVTRQAITELPADVTLSFAAHGQGLQNWVNQARSYGHEVLIELPMESADFNPAEPGADRALRTSTDSSQNIRNLDWLLSRAEGYFAVTNYNGDAFLKRADATAPVMSHLQDAGLGFVYDGSASAPSLGALASSANLPYKQASTLIDLSNDPAAINAELDKIAAQARAGVQPIGVGFAYPQTIDAVKAWASHLNNKGLTLAPASHTLGVH